MTKKQKKVLYRIIAAAVLMVALHFVPEIGRASCRERVCPYV